MLSGGVLDRGGDDIGGRRTSVQLGGNQAPAPGSLRSTRRVAQGACGVGGIEAHRNGAHVVMAIRKPVQRLGASRVAHRLPLNACRTRHLDGTPTGAGRAAPSSALRWSRNPGRLRQPQDLLEASPTHPFSGQAGQRECEPVMS